MNISEIFKFIVFYLFINFSIIIIFWLLNFDKSFFNLAFEAPFEACRVLTNHIYKGTHYGGLYNFLGLIGMYAIAGLVLFAFAFPTSYLIDKYIFQGKFYIEAKTYTENYREVPYYNKILGIFFIILVPIIWNFLTFIILKIAYGNSYNCEKIIEIVEMYY